MKNDKPDYSGRYHPSAGDTVQFLVVGAVGIGVGFATSNVGTGIGAAIIAALVVVFLGIGED
jgi:hypothetical protein